MERRDFIIKSTGLAVTAWMAPKLGYAFPERPGKMDRIGMSTVTFRNRFKQTKPKDINVIENELSLLDIPEYYNSRFNVTKLEFWAPHFESIDRDYLDALKDKVKAAGSKLINIQVWPIVLKKKGWRVSKW